MSDAVTGRSAHADRPLHGRRVAFVSIQNTFATRTGAAEYLSSTAELMRELGAEVDLFVTTPFRPGQLRVPADAMASYLRGFSRVRIRGAARMGEHLYTTNLSDILTRLSQGRPSAVVNESWLAAPSPAAQKWAREMLQATKPDIVVANYFNAATILSAAPGELRAILTHDVLAGRLQSLKEAGVEPDFPPEVVAREAESMRQAQLLFAITDEDASALRQMAQEREVAVLPHHAYVCTELPAGPRGPVALFVGARFSANIEALRWFLGQVWPLVRAQRPEARLRIVGRVADETALDWPDGVERVGFVDSLADEYAGAAAALAPLRFGSGLKIKAVEALGFGVPVVATPIGAQGLRAAPGEAVRVAELPQDYADALCAAFDASAASGSPHRAARDFAQDHFSRQAARDALARALERCALPPRA